MSNWYDPFAVAILEDVITVGHVPLKLFTICPVLVSLWYNATVINVLHA